MKLGYNWFYRPRIDYEMKQYEALAFVQYLEQCLNSNILMPAYAELVLQMDTITSFFKEINTSAYLVNKQISGINLNEKQLEYSGFKPEGLDEVEQIASFMLKAIKPFHESFESFRKKLLDEVIVEPVGIWPVYCDEGWMLLQAGLKTDVYYFRNNKLLDNKGMEGIKTSYYTSFEYNLLDTPSKIKIELVKQHKDLPNPATYIVNSNHPYPVHETLLPAAIEKIFRNNQA